MHFSISTFDYLIIRINNTKAIIDNVEEINNFFSTISEDNSYPAIVSINYNNGPNQSVCNVYDSVSYNKINFIMKKNNGTESLNYIAFNLIYTSNDQLNEQLDDEIDELSGNSISVNNNDFNKFKFSNVADILDIIGTNTQFSFCDNLFMNNINELKFYEFNGTIVLEVDFI
jgi:hypothetical protein